MIEPSVRAIPLQCLRTGQSAQVSRLVGQPDQVHQLQEFGLRNGTRLRMFRPGNPCILRLAGQKVCLRLDDLLSVLVHPTEPVG